MNTGKIRAYSRDCHTIGNHLINYVNILPIGLSSVFLITIACLSHADRASAAASSAMLYTESTNYETPKRTDMASGNVYNALMRQHTPSGIVYVTGGITARERMTMEEAKAHYNLRICNASKNNSYVDGAEIFIYDHQGKQILRAKTAPFFYAMLKPGYYTIKFQKNNFKKYAKLIIKDTPADITLHW